MSAETSTPLARTNPPRSPSAIAWKLTLVLIPLLVAGGLFVLRQSEVSRLAHHQLPKLGVVPPFELTNQNDQPFGSSQLLGKIWLADFVYTTCPGPCAMINSRLSETQKPLRDTEVKLVTFTV
ncbi:MAG TPA: SCO family protein, partial [Chthoniobacterales bacterium]